MLLRRSSQKMELLKKVPMFSNLSQRHLREISKHADQLSAKTGNILAEQGKIGWEFIFIVEGKAESRRMGESSDSCLKVTFSGRSLSSMENPGQQQLLLKTDMILLVVHKTSFDHLLDKVPGYRKRSLSPSASTFEVLRKPPMSN